MKMKKEKDQNKNVKRARHMPKPEGKNMLNIYSWIDKSLWNVGDSNIWKEVVNLVVSVS
jgi:Gpi18-like mannosyltransferase